MLPNSPAEVAPPTDQIDELETALPFTNARA